MKFNPTEKDSFDCFSILFVLPLKGAEDESEIQSVLQATFTEAISEGSIEPGNVTIFNMMPCIQPPQRWLSFYEAVSWWICMASMLRPQEREARTLHCLDTLRIML